MTLFYLFSSATRGRMLRCVGLWAHPPQFDPQKVSLQQHRMGKRQIRRFLCPAALLCERRLTIYSKE